MSFFNQVYAIVNQIPMGFVTTYGDIARALGTRDARKVGWALHGNPDPATPCHRVVSKAGALAPSYAFGGANEQKSKLLSEGVTFDNNIVNLRKHHWQPTKKI